MEQTGRLYLCGTPIGNLGDITYRAVETLRAADCIAAEDTRHTRTLLAHYDIHTPMTSYHEHNKDAKGPELIARLLAGETIVCVSDAGLPGIADPGGDLAQRAIAEGIPVTPLRGASAGGLCLCRVPPAQRQEAQGAPRTYGRISRDAHLLRGAAPPA